MQIELTQQETALILEVLSKVSINPTAPDAPAIVGIIQGLVSKIRPQEPQPATE